MPLHPNHEPLWRKLPRGGEPRLVIGDEGIVLGKTLLAPLRKGELLLDASRVTAMLSVAYGRRVGGKVTDAFRHAARCYMCGDKALAHMHLALKAYDADERVLLPLAAVGKTAVIPPKSNCKIQREYEKELYKARHLIENFFLRLKQYRAIATRYDKTDKNFLAAVYAAAAIILLN